MADMGDSSFQLRGASATPAPSLCRLHARFARNFPPAAAAMLKIPIQMHLSGVEPTGAAQLADECGHWPCFALRLTGPSGDPAVLLASLRGDFAFAMIDRLLGSTDDHVYIPHRPPTALERAVLGRAADLAAAVLLEATGLESHTLARAADAEPGDSPLYQVRFAAAAAGNRGELVFALPQIGRASCRERV